MSNLVRFVALLTFTIALPIGNGLHVGRRSLVPVAVRDSGSVNGTPAEPPSPRGNGSSIKITPEIILEIFPKAKFCPRNSVELYADECKTHEQAAPRISESFEKYNITTKPEAVAILSLMIFESAGFEFNIHHFPSANPGQGTRNMMNFPFILEYAHDVLPEEDLPPVNSPYVDDQEKDEILEKVLGDDLSFATGAWFYQKKCNETTKAAVKTGSEAGWTEYIVQCVGTSVDGRLEGWEKAKKVI